MIYCDIFKVPSIHQESTHCILFNFLICKIIKLHFSAWTGDSSCPSEHWD